MSVLEQIAFNQDSHSDVPNQELARWLVGTQDVAGISEVAANLWNDNAAIQSDCIKVLYEIGYLDPSLVAPYAGNFLQLLRSRNNRLVWGGMIALSTIAGLAADAIDPQRGEIMHAMEQGSVITVDAGVLALARLASTNEQRRWEIFPYLLEHLRSCRPKDVPQHAEKIVIAVDSGNRDDFIRTLEQRMPDMSPTQVARIKRVIKQAGTAP